MSEDSSLKEEEDEESKKLTIKEISEIDNDPIPSLKVKNKSKNSESNNGLSGAAPTQRSNEP